ncbi:MAG: phosphoribosylanthranilate isomerase [Luminiphilus sp.]|nr:phosphoribosylanthranilate isomerase [Luminiphilus sp.]
MQVKICGITNASDARAAAEAGADAIGLVFFPGSKRAVTPEQAAAICEALPPLVTVTALFVNAEAGDVEAVLRSVPVNLLQWHGAETPEFCEQWDLPYIRAVTAEAALSLEDVMVRYPKARGFLIDAVADGQFGGTGHTFDWNVIPSPCSRPIILAGGLNPANVADAVIRVRPAAVDVSTGVERGPGIKDPAKIRQFIRAARAAAEVSTS